MIPEWLHKLEKKNSLISQLGLKSRKLLFKWKNINIEIGAFLRKYGIQQREYKNIEKLKNKYANERCFIIATGPSLNIKDCEKLENEYTFGMNSICLAYDNTNWRPTFYGIQDDNVYKRVESQIKGDNGSIMFVEHDIFKKYKLPRHVNTFKCNSKYNGFEANYSLKYFVEFSEDCHSIVYDGYSITYSLMQIAIYLGFKEIYLLGADCNYEENKAQHFIDYGFVDPTFKTAKDRMIVAYERVNEYAKAHKISIYNATRGGKLEVFQRVNFDNIKFK